MVVGGCKTLPVWSELAVIHRTVALTLYLQAQNKHSAKSTLKKPHHDIYMAMLTTHMVYISFHRPMYPPQPDTDITSTCS